MDKHGKVDWHALANIHLIKNELCITLQVCRQVEVRSLYVCMRDTVNEDEILSSIISMQGFSAHGLSQY